MTLYGIIWGIFMAAIVAMFAISLSAIPQFKQISPNEFLKAGSPSVIFSPIRDMDLIAYLFRNRHRQLPHKGLVRKLSFIKYLWVICQVGLIAIVYLVFRQSLGA